MDRFRHWDHGIATARIYRPTSSLRSYDLRVGPDLRLGLRESKQSAGENSAFHWERRKASLLRANLSFISLQLAIRFIYADATK